MECPRCGQELMPVRVSTVSVEFCPHCEGTWYDLEELETVLALPDLRLSQLRPALAPNRKPAVANKQLERPVSCPRCGRTLIREHYGMGCQVEVDRCPAHGIWLDDGELGELLEHHESFEQSQPQSFLDYLRGLLSN